MDNPWANAWGDSTTVTSPNLKSDWKSPLTIPTDDEHDISIPSWSGSPPHSPREEPSIWSQATSFDPTPAWGPSRFTDILNASKSSVNLAEAQAEVPLDHGDAVVLDERKVLAPKPVSPLASPASSSHSGSTEEIAVHAQVEESLSSLPHIAEVAPPPSPDGFGTFATAEMVDELTPEMGTDPWARPNMPIEETSDWADSTDAVRGDSLDIGSKVTQTEDEWEASRQMQDRHVPREIIDAIITRFEELSTKLQPSSESEAPTQEFSGIHQGLYGVSGLYDTVERMLPEDVALTQYTPFASSFAAKGTAEAVKMTRHIPFTKSSPMAQFLAAKGSTSWEISVKSRSTTIQDDVTPKGWKIVEKEAGIEPAPELKPSGGLLSFFGRRSTNPAPVATKSGSSSPRAQTPTTVNRSSFTSSASPRASVEINSSSMPPKVATPHTRPTSGIMPSSSNMESNASPPPLADTPKPLDIFPDVKPAPQPSAVSRFLNRFSRTRSGSNSVALSSDDLEFLNDIVPSAGDEDEILTGDPQLRALSNMIHSNPVSTKLPPPLPPPPPPAPLRVPSSSSQASLPTISKISPTLPPTHRAPKEEQSPTDASWSNTFDYPNVLQPSRGSSVKRPILPQIPTSPPHTRPSSNSEGGFASLDGTFATLPTAPPPQKAQYTPPIFPQTSGGRPRPAQKRSTFTAIMSSSSSSPAGSITSLFALAPPPAVSPPPTSSTPTPLQPPPSFNSQRASSSLSPPPISLFGDDDDFDDFHSGPLQPTQSLQGPMTDDFADFVTTGFTPSMSSNLAGSSWTSDLSTMNSNSSSPVNPTTPPKSPQPSRTGSRVDASQLQRTQSLVDSASSQQGRWPAPQSPLPPSISPPRPVHEEFDLFGDGGNASSRDSGGFDLFRSELGGQQQTHPPTSRAFGSFGVSSMGAPTPPILPPNGTKSCGSGNNGLSAQDLSFFERL